MRIVLSVVLLLFLLSLIKRLIARTASLDVKLLIVVLIFGGAGYAIGDHYSDGWAWFGAVLGGLIAVEVKENFYRVVKMLHDELREDEKG